MKRILALMLLCFMCVSLVACGGANESTRSAVMGSWICEEDGSVVQINEDSTGSVSYDEDVINFTWKYDEATRMLLATLVDDTYTEALTYIEVDDTMYAGGLVYKRAN